MSKTQVVSLINMKGGVGKTTLAVNLAAHMAHDAGLKVLLIDADPQTNATLSLMSPRKWEKWTNENGSMADVFEIESVIRNNEDFLKLKKCIIRGVVPEIPSFDLLPGHLKLTFIDLELASRAGRERILNRKLAKIKDDYDVVLIDCPPNLQAATQNALYASDWYLAPPKRTFYRPWGSSCSWTGSKRSKRNWSSKLNVLASCSRVCARVFNTTWKPWIPGRKKRTFEVYPSWTPSSPKTWQSAGPLRLENLFCL